MADGVYNAIFIPDSFAESIEFNNLGFEPKGLILMHNEERGSKSPDNNTVYNLYAEKEGVGFVASFSNTGAQQPLMAVVSNNTVEWGADYVRIPNTYTWSNGGYSLPLDRNYEYRVIIWS